MVVVAGGAHKVLFISGKQSGPAAGAGSGLACGASFSRSISVVLPSSASSDTDSNSSTSTGPPLRKRQRLTHLSPEEKALRRKLKNRVAAQTARDRKKAKMGELEQQVLELELENEKLHLENELLRDKTDVLFSQNQELRQRLGLDTLDAKEKVDIPESSGSEAALGTGSSESAELRLRVPPQKVQAQPSSRLKTSQWIQMILTLQTLSLISCWVFLTSLTQSTSCVRSARTRRCSSLGVAVQYRPPALRLWGPHQQSWTPLMD